MSDPTPSTSSPADAAAAGAADTAPLTIVAKWGGKQFEVTTYPHETVGIVKQRLQELTEVPSKRQKLIGFCKGKLPSDETTLAELKIKDNMKFMMMGTVDKGIIAEAHEVDVGEVINDLDWDYDPKTSAPRNNPDNLKKLHNRISKTEITFINQPREGKKLLVLDIDYTIFDMKSQVDISLLARPGLHEFMTAAFQDYDIAFWSQTHWRAIEMKLTELGVLTNPGYHICFVLDRTSMFPIRAKVGGTERNHEVKALDLIWAKLPQYSKKNTVHVDDLSRNFAMNPENGIKCVAYKNCMQTHATDRELVFLTKYLKKLASVEDFSQVSHDKWREESM
eukprot:GFYU01005341.1.p1 GENE.GFYU01005341.1~~GFYU01005341.1.p1  ORF type:complete len:349 (-),score=95.13 GFYU01005341.1:254-1261(-)